MSNTPQIRFAGFTDAWEQRKLDTLVEFYSGLTYKPEDVTENGTLVLRSSNVKNSEVVLTDNVYVDESVVNSENVKKDDIIVVVRNGSKALIGKHAKIRHSMPNTVIGAFMTGIRSDSPDFINALLSTDTFDKEIKMNMGATINQITGYMFANMEFMTPSFQERQAVGSFFSRLDDLITLHQREYFTFDFNSRSAKIAQNTLSWEQRKLSDLFEERNEQAPMDEEYPLMAFIANIGVAPKGDRYDRSALVHDEKGKKYKRTEKGDFIYSSNNLETGSIGLNNYGNACISPVYSIFKSKHTVDPEFMGRILLRKEFINQMVSFRQGVVYGQWKIHEDDFLNLDILVPQTTEQQKIGGFFSELDKIITLHQREPPKEDKILNDIKTDTLFHEYYCQWLVIYKEGSVRGVTMQKYHLTAEWVKKLIPDVKLCDFDRITYQQLINDYAETHERQTTMDFHHQLKGAILDAVDDGLIARDPTRKVIIKGKSPNDKKKKYLSRYELQKLLTSLDLNSGLNMDWLILLIAKTGMRFSEAIAVTPVDFDFTHQTLSVNKTWDYKGEGGFQPTKNKSSVRKIRLDWQTVGQFYAIVRELNDTAPIFVSKEKKIYNSTLNDVLERHCKAVGIPTISVHGLRHTHASLLLFDGVSIASVAQRLGHSSINTTQKTYLHIIRELENKDIDLIMKSISSLLD